jgi:hypothetical protein
MPSSRPTARSTSPTGRTSSSATCSTTCATRTATTNTAASTASPPPAARVAEARRHRRPADPRAARKPEASHRWRAPSHPHRTQRARFQGSHRRHAGMDEAVRPPKKKKTRILSSKHCGFISSTTSATRSCSRRCSSRPNCTPATPRMSCSTFGSTSRPVPRRRHRGGGRRKSPEVRHPQRHPELTTIRIATVPERMMYDVKELT